MVIARTEEDDEVVVVGHCLSGQILKYVAAAAALSVTGATFGRDIGVNLHAVASQ